MSASSAFYRARQKNPTLRPSPRSSFFYLIPRPRRSDQAGLAGRSWIQRVIPSLVRLNAPSAPSTCPALRLGLGALFSTRRGADFPDGRMAKKVREPAHRFLFASDPRASRHATARQESVSVHACTCASSRRLEYGETSLTRVGHPLMSFRWRSGSALMKHSSANNHTGDLDSFCFASSTTPVPQT